MIQFWSKFHIQIFWYSFTRDNRFLLTARSLSQENMKKLPLAPLDTVTSAFVCIFSSILK